MSAKLLYLDIETSPIVVHAWSLRDLSVGLNQIVDDPRMIGIGFKWGHERGVTFLSEFHQSRLEMLERTYNALDEADIVLGYNSRGFDIPWINGELAREGFLPPSPFRQVDLYREARKNFRFPSHKLQYVSTALGLPGKRDTGGHTLWVRCMAGDPVAWKKMETYCKRDVALLPTLHQKLLPWIGNHPNLALYEDAVVNEDGKAVPIKACPNCLSDKLQKRGYAVKQTRRYQRYQCQGCGTWTTDLASDTSMKIEQGGAAR